MLVNFYKIEDESIVDRQSQHFCLRSQIISLEDSISDMLALFGAKFVDLIAAYETRGSGYVFEKIQHLDLIIIRHHPIMAGCFTPLPKCLKNKTRALVDLKMPANENRCLALAVVVALFSHRIQRPSYKKYLKYLKYLNLKGVNFPSKKQDIKKLETLNPHLSICVYMAMPKCSQKKMSFFPFYTTMRPNVNDETLRQINLLMLERADGNYHFVCIKSMSALFKNFHTKHTGTVFVCRLCLNVLFGKKETYDTHVSLCSKFKSGATIYPPDEPRHTLKFENWQNRISNEILMVADFETFNAKPKKDGDEPNIIFDLKPFSYAYATHLDADTGIEPPSMKVYLDGDPHDCGLSFITNVKKDLFYLTLIPTAFKMA